MPKPKLRVASSHLRCAGEVLQQPLPKDLHHCCPAPARSSRHQKLGCQRAALRTTTAALTTLAKIPTEVRWPSLFGHSAKHARPGTPPPKTGAGAGVRTSAHPPLGYRPVGRVPAVCSRKSLKPPKGGEGGREKSAFEPRASAANAGSCSYSHTCATQQLLR